MVCELGLLVVNFIQRGKLGFDEVFSPVFNNIGETENSVIVAVYTPVASFPGVFCRGIIVECRDLVEIWDHPASEKLDERE